MNFPVHTGFASVIMVKTYPTRQFFALFAFLLFAGCADSFDAKTATQGPKLQPVSLNVAAASDLQPWLGDALKIWGQNQSPPIVVQTSYAATGQIAAQVRAGAPIDLFLAADIAVVGDLAGQQLAIPESVSLYALGQLALVHHGNIKLSTWKELNQPEIKHLAIANPDTAPYGRAARSALQQAGLWPAVESRVVNADSVRQALQLVLSGNADAGLVSLGQAREAVGKNPAFRCVELPAGSHPAIRQGLAVIPHKDQSEPTRQAALALAQWLTSPANNSLFQQHGLGRP